MVTLALALAVVLSGSGSESHSPTASPRLPATPAALRPPITAPAAVGSAPWAPLTNEELVSQANAICRQANQRVEALHVAPPTPAGFVALLDSEQRIAAEKGRGLEYLTPPAKQQHRYTAFVDSYLRMSGLLAQVEYEFMGGDVRELRRDARELTKLRQASAKLASSLRLVECRKRAHPRHPELTAPLVAAKSGFADLPMGRWDANGSVLQASGYADEKAGTQLARRWTFSSDCQPGDCQTLLTRQTANGAATGRVVRSGSGYAIEFHQLIACTPSSPAELTSRFWLSVSEGGQMLVAAETQRLSAIGCADASASVRWVAHPSAGTPS